MILFIVIGMIVYVVVNIVQELHLIHLNHVKMVLLEDHYIVLKVFVIHGIVIADDDAY